MNSSPSLSSQVQDASFLLPNRRLRQPAALLLAASLFTVPSAVFGFWEVARGEVILHTTGRATYDSNVYAQSNAQDDFYFSLIPELQYLREAGLGTIDARAGVDITRFLDFTNEDFENFFASLNVTYPVRRGSPLSGGFTTAYTQHSRVNEYLNTRIREDNFTARIDTRYQTSERLGLRNALSYNYADIRNFSDVEAYAGTFGVQWAYSPALALFTDYRIRRTQSDGDNTVGGGRIDNLDHAVFFGAEGQLRPRLRGVASVGYQHSDARDQGADRNLIVSAIELAYLLRPQTDLTFAVSRDLDVSPLDETVEATGVSIGIEHRIPPQIRLTSYVGYHESRFRGGAGRTDEAIRLGAAALYSFSRYWDAGLAHDYTNNDSTLGVADFSRHVTSIFTRYSF